MTSLGASIGRERSGYRRNVDDFVFPESWWDLRGNDAEVDRLRGSLERELQREIAPGHPLYGRSAKAVARCHRCDDALFDLEDGQFAQVHLSYPKQAPDRPPYPKTTELRDWARACEAVEDHARWE